MELSKKKLYENINFTHISQDKGNNSVNVRPLLKWAGGKTQMLNILLPLIPKQYVNYIEPFLEEEHFFLHINLLLQ